MFFSFLSHLSKNVLTFFFGTFFLFPDASNFGIEVTPKNEPIYFKRDVRKLDVNNENNFRLPCCTSKKTENGYGWVGNQWTKYFPTHRGGSHNFNMSRKEFIDQILENVLEDQPDADKKVLRGRISSGMANLSRAVGMHFRHGIDGCSQQFPQALCPQKNKCGRKVKK